MKALNLFLPHIMPYAMGCPKVNARQALVSAAIEFCEQTLLVRATLAAVDLVAGTYTYTPTTPTHEAMVMPVGAWFKGAELAPVAADEIHNPQAFAASIPDVEAETGDPREFFALTAGQIGLYPIPETSESGVLLVRAALRPTRAATQLEDVLLEDWVETLAAGALYRLHSTAGQAYTDAAQAERRFIEFRRGIQRAKVEASRGRVRGALQVRMRPLA
jgi:hypothetical protein